MNTNVFDLTKIHQKYWKGFCDVCYSRFGFEMGEIRTYEQKYETFCRCKMFVTEETGYEQQLLCTREEDLRKLTDAARLFYSLRDARDMIPMLYALCTLSHTISENIKSDIELVRYMCPRALAIDFHKYHLDAVYDGRDDVRRDCKISELTDHNLKELIQRLDIPPYIDDSLRISEATRKIANRTINYYNACLMDMEAALPDGCDCERGHELQAFLYRLFMSYEDSLPDIKERLEEYPSPRNLQILQSEREQLIAEFQTTKLGKHWMECIEDADGLSHIAKYFMHEHKRIIEEDERVFFYTLDKICIITDILNGLANKYWLEVSYPDNWSFNPIIKSSSSKNKKTKSTPQINKKHITFSANGINSGHITLLYQHLMDIGWIPRSTPADEFQRLFMGKSCVCRITWTGGGKGNLRELFRIMREQQLITIPGNNGLETILEAHFVDEEGYYLTGLNSSKPSKKSLPIINECIRLLQQSFDFDS